MTRDQANKLLPFITAWAEGKTVLYLEAPLDEAWGGPAFDGDPEDYTIAVQYGEAHS